VPICLRLPHRKNIRREKPQRHSFEKRSLSHEGGFALSPFTKAVK
jgi:hypothetical protein